MIDEDVALKIAQVSSVIATVLGVIILQYMWRARRRIDSENIGSAFLFSVAFMALFLTGVASMTIYHLAEESYEEASENAETLWYFFMFVAFLFSYVESFKLRKLERYVSSIKSQISQFSDARRINVNKQPQ